MWMLLPGSEIKMRTGTIITHLVGVAVWVCEEAGSLQRWLNARRDLDAPLLFFCWCCGRARVDVLEVVK